jgi:hypothetical protein
MAEKPILFSAPMVRAILDGRKTQTRRTLTPQPVPVGGPFYRPYPIDEPTEWHSVNEAGITVNIQYTPIAPGDLLWVREAWRAMPTWDRTAPRDIERESTRIYYEADDGLFAEWGKMRPGMFMCRWMSRLTLKVAEIQVQRLQDISEEDAKAEGAQQDAAHTGRFDGAGNPEECGSYRLGFMGIWNSINGPGSWEANPWVAAYTFERVN